MDFIKSEMQKEFSAVGFKNQRRNLNVSSHQTGKSDKGRDETRHALLPGKRISKSGNKYYENRSNRSDKRNSKL
jgi:hypothetical protein